MKFLAETKKKPSSAFGSERGKKQESIHRYKGEKINWEGVLIS